MHIPDGFISPVVYAPLLAAEAALLYLAYRKVKDVLGDDGALGLLINMLLHLLALKPLNQKSLLVFYIKSHRIFCIK